MQHARPNRLRRAVAYAVLAAVLGLVSLTLSQCTLVGDSTTGVEINRAGQVACIHACNLAKQAAIEQCKRTHETAREVCQAMPEGPERDACEAAATQARLDCEADASADSDVCKANCHRQGAGSAG